jgi:hypothetical protein
MANILPYGFYIRVKLECNITRVKNVRGDRHAEPPSLSGSGQFLDADGGNPYKLPQRNDAEDGTVRNFIAQELVIVGGRTAGDG